MKDNQPNQVEHKSINKEKTLQNSPPLIFYTLHSRQSSYSQTQNKRFQSPSLQQNIVHQNFLQKVRKLISHGLINQAIDIINTNLNKMKQQQLAQSGNSQQESKINSQKSNQRCRLELLFCQATCYLSLKKYEQGLQTLLQIQRLKENFKINKVQLLIAICYRSLNNHLKSLEVINNSLLHYDTHQNFNISQHLFLKGTILKNLNKLDQAQVIFQEILINQPHHQGCEKELLNIYSKLQNYQEAHKLIHQALSNQNINYKHKLFLNHQRLYLLYKTQQYQTCLHHLNQFQQKLQKLHFIKGKIFLKLSRYQDAIISFNQLLQSNSDPIYVKFSLIQLIVYFLKQRDYYEASLYAKRKTHLFSSSVPELQHLSFLTQGLIFLKKKNFEDGLRVLRQVNINLFTQLNFQISIQKSDQQFIRNLLLNGEGYALFSLGKHDEALIKYENLIVKQHDEEYLGCHYNKQMILGILNYTINQNQSKSIQHFQTALTFIKRPEPYFYMAVIMAQKCIKNSDVIERVLSLLSKGINLSQNADMLYYRALIYVELGLNLQAMQDLQKAIDISQDNIVQHFYAKAIVFFLQQNFEEAIGEFDIALSIDEKHSKCYLQKSKCFLFIGNYNEAYDNLKQYRSLCDDNTPWELYFMLYQQNYHEVLHLISKEQALGILENIDEENNRKQKDGIGLNIDEGSVELEEIREKCNFYLGRLEESGSGGKLVLGVMYGDYEQALMLLQEAVQLRVNVGAVPYQQMSYLKGYLLFKMNSYQQALTEFHQIQRQLSNGQVPLADEQIQLRLLMVKMNIFYCLYCQGQLRNSLDKLTLLIADVNEGPILEQLKRISNFISPSQTQSQKFNQQYQTKNLNCQSQPYCINILQNHRLLSHYFPSHSHLNLTFKILIPFPDLHIPQLLPNAHHLLQQFTIKSIQNKPEPPWIKRGHFGLNFTNNIKQYSHLHIDTEQNDKQHTIHDLKFTSSVQQKLQKIILST